MIGYVFSYRGPGQYNLVRRSDNMVVAIIEKLDDPFTKNGTTYKWAIRGPVRPAAGPEDMYVRWTQWEYAPSRKQAVSNWVRVHVGRNGRAEYTD